MLQGGKIFTNHLTTHCFMQCAVYTFSLHSILSTVGHMEKEPESKTPPTTTPPYKLCQNRCDQYRQWQHQTMEQLALTNGKNLRRYSTLWIMTNEALKIPLISPRKSIYTAIVYNDLCIIMYLKQYDISLLHTQHARTCISTQIHTVHTYIHM